VHEVEVRLQTLEQFFNSMDPSPFYDKDLDPDAEHYIVSWAEEFPLHEPVRLVLHLDTGEVDEKLQATVEKAVHSHFSNQARLARVEFRRLMRVGSRSLAIGLAVLAACLLGGELLTKYNGPVFEILRQSLLIGGWVAMWHPMQIYLHSWWPLRRRWRVYQKLARMGVEVRATRRVENPAPVASR
jgi:hypothetical protein